LPRLPGTTPWDDPGYTREQAGSDDPPPLGSPAYAGYVTKVKQELRDAGHRSVDVLALSGEVPVSLVRDTGIDFESLVVLPDAERRAEEKGLRFATPPRFWWWRETVSVESDGGEPEPAAGTVCWVMVVPCVPKEPEGWAVT
jgi:hypothetical protein